MLRLHKKSNPPGTAKPTELPSAPAVTGKQEQQAFLRHNNSNNEVSVTQSIPEPGKVLREIEIQHRTKPTVVRTPDDGKPIIMQPRVTLVKLEDVGYLKRKNGMEGRNVLKENIPDHADG